MANPDGARTPPRIHALLFLGTSMGKEVVPTFLKIDGGLIPCQTPDSTEFIK
jgi:hypothetical protein